jgi:quinol monooxygenase YgiN
MKHARNVHFQIKNGKELEFTKLFETDVLPTLRKQDGFKEELMLVDGRSALGISVWDEKGSADKYQATAYPRLLEKLSPVLESTPRVENYQIGMTTLRA